MEIGVASRINLLFLTLASFIPQLLRLGELKTYDGISLTYTFLNLLLATEEFALGAHILVVRIDRSLGDWLNACQFGVVWLYHAVIVFIGLRLPPIRTGLKTTMSTVCVCHFFISIVAVIVESGTSPSNFWYAILFEYPHYLFISPIATVLGIVSVLFQAHTMLSRRSLGALSLYGLGCQSVIFTLVKYAWIWRYEAYHWPFGTVWWLRWVGWASLDNLIFALVQGVLFCIAWRRRDGGEVVREREPLLQP